MSSADQGKEYYDMLTARANLVRACNIGEVLTEYQKSLLSHKLLELSGLFDKDFMQQIIRAGSPHHYIDTGNLQRASADKHIQNVVEYVKTGKTPDKEKVEKNTDKNLEILRQASNELTNENLETIRQMFKDIFHIHYATTIVVRWLLGTREFEVTVDLDAFTDEAIKTFNDGIRTLRTRLYPNYTYSELNDIQINSIYINSGDNIMHATIRGLVL